jgi:hypothetical protein
VLSNYRLRSSRSCAAERRRSRSLQAPRPRRRSFQTPGVLSCRPVVPRNEAKGKILDLHEPIGRHPIGRFISRFSWMIIKITDCTTQSVRWPAASNARPSAGDCRYHLPCKSARAFGNRLLHSSTTFRQGLCGALIKGCNVLFAFNRPSGCRQSRMIGPNHLPATPVS